MSGFWKTGRTLSYFIAMPMSTGKAASAASRLAQSTSPYLRQHASNPVEWYQWGEEAFKAARAQNKPIFVSIGYSTCHWCHVMAHESFEDVEIAKIMNDNFVNVKVDREERPDLDRQYMKYVQATSGTAGWPLSIFLSPALKPLYGGTYFPARDDSLVGRPSFKSILEAINQRWKEDARSFERNGADILTQLKKMADIVPTGSDHGGNVVRIKSIQRAFLNLEQSFDSQFSGFGSGNKFPMPGTLGMLLRYWALWKDLDREAEYPSLQDLRQNFEGVTDESKLRSMWRETVNSGMKMAKEARDMVYFTLIRMARGGIHDHVSGGFHRYTVDRAWTLPHFEKMLYDQAQLIKLYSEAYLVFDRNPEFENVVRKAVEYVKERLTCPKTGAFYAAEDADSLNKASGEVEEGAFAVWRDEEVNELLKGAGWSLEDLKVFKYHFTILPRGNLANLTNCPELKVCNVLLERADSKVTAEKLARPQAEVEDILKRGLAILKGHRDTSRPFPERDEKVVTSWNGLMIGALAVASRVFENEEYLGMARAAWSFLSKSAMRQEGEYLRLQRSYFSGQAAGIEGFAEDYAASISAALELHQVAFEGEYLKVAERLQETLDGLFRDKAGGGYYDCVATADGLFRTKDSHDGVEPSANSLVALNCIKMSILTGGKKVYTERFRQILRVFTKQLDKEPHSMTTLVSAIIMDSAKPVLLTLTPQNSQNGQHEIVLEAVAKNFLPHLLIKMENENVSGGGGGGSGIGHICKGNVCASPIKEPAAILKELGI